MTDTLTPALNQRLTGRIAYRASDGTELGREFFELINHSGGRILRALCAMDDVSLLRDVSLSMRPDWTPEEGYCRVTKHGTQESTLWFRVEETGVRVDTQLGGEAHAQMFIETSQRLPYLGLHPLQGDAIIAQQRGTDALGEFRAIESVTNSVSPNGDEAPGGTRLEIDVAYMGEESITVTAGTFQARRYALRWREDWPAADLWVRDDNLFLLMRWSMIDTWYELTEWNEA
jgi:hypothetical protein